MGAKDAPVHLLNNYHGSGIGDWGLGLLRALTKRKIAVSSEETIPGWKGYIPQLFRILDFRGLVIANVGLTGWGDSGPRNFLGFAILGLRAWMGRRTIVLFHHVIEALQLEDSGYHISPLTVAGGHLAVKLASRASTIAITDSVYNSILQNYSFAPSAKLFLPCEPPMPIHEKGSPRPKVTTVGYLAPYKGLELFVEITRDLGGEVTPCLVGSPHRILSSTPGFSEWARRVQKSAREAGVEVYDRLPEEALLKLLRESTLGILCYKSSSGGSAAFCTLASATVPVIATDLPAFRELKAAGAGIVLCKFDARDFANSIRGLLGDPATVRRLSEQQSRFASAHSWERFLEGLFAVA